MSVFGMSDDEKKKILSQHKDATKSHYLKKEELKKGVQSPNKDKPSQ